MNQGLMKRIFLKKYLNPPNIVGVIKWSMRWAWQVACMGDRRGVFRVLVGKPEGM